jgi:hypothetical protein
LHQPAVADHVGGQDRGKAALDAFISHVKQSFFSRQVTGLYWRSKAESIRPTSPLGQKQPFDRPFNDLDSLVRCH